MSPADKLVYGFYVDWLRNYYAKSPYRVGDQSRKFRRKYQITLDTFWEILERGREIENRELTEIEYLRAK